MNGHHHTNAARGLGVTFGELTEQTCLACMGRGAHPVSVRNKLSGRLVPIQATCPRCLGTGTINQR